MIQTSNGAPCTSYHCFLPIIHNAYSQFTNRGDSWATGVRAKDADDYNPGSTDCLRTNYAYAPQLETDTSWTGGKQENFQFAACSGARLVDMVHGQQQIVNTNEPRLVTMTAGGNNVCMYLAFLFEFITHIQAIKIRSWLLDYSDRMATRPSSQTNSADLEIGGIFQHCFELHLPAERRR